MFNMFATFTLALLVQQVVSYSLYPYYYYHDINRRDWNRLDRGRLHHRDLDTAYADPVPARTPAKKLAYPNDDFEPAAPYNFAYDIKDDLGNRQFRSEESDGKGTVRGSYGYTDASGLYRIVEYIADAFGFRAHVRSNEPGLIDPSASVSVVAQPSPPKSLTQSPPRSSSSSSPPPAVAAVVVPQPIARENKPFKTVSASNTYSSIQSSALPPNATVTNKRYKVVRIANVHRPDQTTEIIKLTPKPVVDKPFKIVRIANVHHTGLTNTQPASKPASDKPKVTSNSFHYKPGYKLSDDGRYTHVLAPFKPKSTLGTFVPVTLPTSTTSTQKNQSN